MYFAFIGKGSGDFDVKAGEDINDKKEDIKNLIGTHIRHHNKTENQGNSLHFHGISENSFNSSLNSRIKVN